MNARTAQRDAARLRANEVRLRHSAFRRRLAAMSTVDGAHLVADLLDTLAAGDDSDALAEVVDAELVWLLCTVRQYREARALVLLRRAGVRREVSRTARGAATWRRNLLRVDELTPREAAAVADALRLANPRLAFDETPKPLENA